MCSVKISSFVVNNWASFGLTISKVANFAGHLQNSDATLFSSSPARGITQSCKNRTFGFIKRIGQAEVPL